MSLPINIQLSHNTAIARQQTCSSRAGHFLNHRCRVRSDLARRPWQMSCQEAEGQRGSDLRCWVGAAHGHWKDSCCLLSCPARPEGSHAGQNPERRTPIQRYGTTDALCSVPMQIYPTMYKFAMLQSSVQAGGAGLGDRPAYCYAG